MGGGEWSYQKKYGMVCHMTCCSVCGCGFSPKGDNVDVKVISEDSSVQQCFVVFDVLMINTSNLANCPLVDRIQKLKKSVGGVEHEGVAGGRSICVTVVLFLYHTIL